MAVFVVALATGCAPKDFQEPGLLPASGESTQKMFKSSYSTVWQAALSVLESKKYVVAASQKDGGVIITDWVMGKSDRLFSGYGENRIPYSIRFKLTLRLQPGRSGVEVKIDNEEQYLTDSVTGGTDFSGSLFQWVSTQSSHAKEAVVLSDIENLLNRTKGEKAKK